MRPAARPSPFRLLALLAAAGLGACAAVPGPYEQQAAQAAQACQFGNAYACRDYQALQSTVAAEQAQGQQDAATNTAVLAGVLGLAAGAAILASSNDNDHGYRRRHDDRRYDGRRADRYRDRGDRYRDRGDRYQGGRGYGWR